MKQMKLFGVILTILMLSFVSSAQTDELIAYRNGDLVTWSLSNNVPEQITFWGYNGGGVLSPDGSTIAFLSYGDEVAEGVVNQEYFTEGDLPANIWVMDIATREFNWINDQSTASADGGVLRSPPVWSPDGTRLAWVELIEYPIVSLLVYDFDTETITSISNSIALGYQDAGTYIPRIQWGDGGISRVLFNIVGDDFTGQNVLEVYDPDTGELFSMNLDFLTPGGNGYVSHHWVNDSGESKIAIQVDSTWGLIDPRTQSYTPLNNPPSLQRVGDSSLQLIPIYTGSYSFEWYAIASGQVSPLSFNARSILPSSQPTISPNGRVVAWHDRTGIFIWDTGSQQTQMIIENDETLSYDTPEPVNVVWSPMEWVTTNMVIAIDVRPTSAPTVAPPTQAPLPTAVPAVSNNCKTAAMLSPGEYAVLSPGQNNNVRQSWSANSQLFGEIYPGEVVYVQDGPVCSEGYNWYLVSNEFIYGWTAEGFDGQYWLTANIDFTNCWNSPPARLTPGAKGTVLSGSPNRIRAQPGIGNSAILGEIPGNGVFVIDGFPVCGDDGRRWYPVTYAGISGWTPEGEGSTYWVAPGG